MTSEALNSLKVGDSIYWPLGQEEMEELVVFVGYEYVQTIDYKGSITELRSDYDIVDEYSIIAHDPVLIDRSHLMGVLREKIEDLEDIIIAIRGIKQ